ncbi:MAG: hypothetical protein HZA32_18405 [Opitutae bacterium]|nr:hypothetical protein [Opitutae bacterium]
MHSPRCALGLLLAALSFCPAALGADAPAPTVTSPRLQAALRAQLPKFEPRAPAESAPAPANTFADPQVTSEGVVLLPDYRVIEKKVAEPHPDDWLKGDVVTRREMRRLEADMTTLELLLNRWSIPLVGPSFVARARGRYEAKKFRAEFNRFLDLAKTVETFDPRAAQELRDALDFRKLPKEKGK